MQLALTRDQIILFNLLLRIAVMAGIVSLVIGFRFVGEMLSGSSDSRTGRVRLFLLLTFVFVMGILVRRHLDQGAMDLSLEGALLAGFVGGAWVGAGVGTAIGFVCFLFGETVALPLYASAGLASGLLFNLLGIRGQIWSYSLNPFLIVYSFFERLFHRRLDRNFLPFAVLIAFSMIRYGLLKRFGPPHGLLYGYGFRDGFLFTLDIAVLVFTLGIALKMVKNTRMEIRLREEEKQLTHARLTTLRSQINPHFLFNTLNTISVLIRTDPEKAREMTRRLSSIFRKSLDDASDTHSLDDELSFIENYLSIERVRFGDDKLSVVKDIDPETLGMEVPTMILQPLVENAVKHGISRLVSGGCIRFSSRISRSGLEVEVANDGPGAGPYDLEELFKGGMGLRNVAERLNIYTCGEGRLDMAPREGGGAAVRILIPLERKRRGTVEDQCVDSR